VFHFERGGGGYTVRVSFIDLQYLFRLL
jgi:hypothetical protein